MFSSKYFYLGHDLRPPEPIRRPYRRRSQSELFAPLLPETMAVAALSGTAQAADNDAKPSLVEGHASLTNGDLVALNGGVIGMQPMGGAVVKSDADPDKKGRS